MTNFENGISQVQINIKHAVSPHGWVTAAVIQVQFGEDMLWNYLSYK